MTDFPLQRIDELAHYLTVGFVGSMADLFTDEGVPLLRGQNIKPYSLDLSNLKFISQGTHKKWKKSSLEAGDVVIVRVGYPGTACVIPPGMGPLNAASLVIVRPNKALLDPHYLAYVLNSPWGKATINGRLVGAAQQVFNTNTAAETPIPAPSVEIQRRIASILSAYDDLIENNTRRIAILEEMARRIYEEWFVRFRFPGHENARMVESELGLVPEGWMPVRLSVLADVNARSIKRGAEPDEIVYVDISSVSTASIDQRQRMAFSEAPGRARRIVRDGDVIWACVRPNRKSFAAVIDPEPGLIVSTGFAVLSATTAPWPYVYYAVTTEDFVGYLVNHAKGAAYPAVGAEDFENAALLKPNDEVLNDFGKIAEPMLRLAASLSRKNANLRATRDLLLPKLISGELDVSAMSEPEAVAA